MRRISWILLVVALLLSFGVRYRLLDMPLERDEGEYAYAGQLLLQGTPPYQAAYNMKLPGTYLAYAASMAVFGQTVAGVHWGLIVVNLAAIALVFLLAKDLFDPLAGGFAAMTYSLFALGPWVLGMAAHATHFVAAFGVAGVWVLWRATQSDRKTLLFVAGSLLGAAFLMKQQGVFLMVFGGLAVVLHDFRQTPRSWRKMALDLPIFSLGAILPYLAVCFWLWHVDTFDRFWFWTVSYARQYVQQMPLDQVWQVFRGTFFSGIVAACWPLWIAVAAGLISVGWGRGDREAKWFAYLYFAFAFACVCPGFFFRQHYFIVWLPAAAVFAGAACSQLISFTLRRQDAAIAAREQAAQKRAKNRKNGPVSAENAENVPRPFNALLLAAALLIAAAFGIAVVQNSVCLFLLPPKQLCRRIYFPNPFVESQEIADFIRQHTKPDQTVAVLGSEPQLFFLMQRASATGYIYTYPLMESQDFASKMQREMVEEIEKAKPEFLVFVNVPFSWLPRPGSDKFVFEWADRYIKSDYRPVGLIEMTSPVHPPRTYWGDQMATAQPNPQLPGHIWVFQRKK